MKTLRSFTDFSSVGFKVRLFKDAGVFCVSKGLEVFPVSDFGQDAGFGTFASVEVKFRCVRKNLNRQPNGVGGFNCPSR